jgi:hypothetical protein
MSIHAAIQKLNKGAENFGRLAKSYAARASRLRAMSAELLAFDRADRSRHTIDAAKLDTIGGKSLPSPAKPPKVKKEKPDTPTATKPGRREQISKFLEGRQPTTVDTIVSALKIPKGTVFYVPHSGDLFVQNKDRKWSLKQAQSKPANA